MNKQILTILLLIQGIGCNAEFADYPSMNFENSNCQKEHHDWPENENKKIDQKKLSNLDLLMEDSFIRKLSAEHLPCANGTCEGLGMGRCKNCATKKYYLPELEKHLYCASIYHKGLESIEDKTHDELIACNNCKLSKTLQDKNQPYNRECYLIKNLGEDFGYDIEEIVKEQKEFIELMEKRNKPIADRVNEWEKKEFKKKEENFEKAIEAGGKLYLGYFVGVVVLPCIMITVLTR